jgi:integrase
LRFHDLRHTAATLLLRANVNTKVVPEMRGHSQTGVTMDLYQHVIPTMPQAAPQVFDTLLSAPVAVTSGCQQRLNQSGTASNTS